MVCSQLVPLSITSLFIVATARFPAAPELPDDRLSFLGTCPTTISPLNLDDTIVAIATPPGRGGIGVVRIAGPEARAIALPMLRLKQDLEPGRAIFGELVEPWGADPVVRGNAGNELGNQSRAGGAAPHQQRHDEDVITYFAKPHSYTSDDVVVISAHGSPGVRPHIVELAVARGARLAEAGRR